MSIVCTLCEVCHKMEKGLNYPLSSLPQLEGFALVTYQDVLLEEAELYWKLRFS